MKNGKLMNKRLHFTDTHCDASTVALDPAPRSRNKEQSEPNSQKKQEESGEAGMAKPSFIDLPWGS
jgi:hypothetical protein